MPPRGRPRKRLGRMDAAVDAMAPLGFDECLVKKTVYRLLKVYGGDEWWPFIEEYGYKELIEAILAHQEEEQTQGVSSPDERAEDPDLGRTIGPSGTLVDSTCNERSAIGPSEVFCLPTAEGGRNRWKDIGEDRPSIKKGMDNDACSDGGNSVNPGSKSHVFAPPPTSSPCTVNHLKMCSGSQVLPAGSNSHVIAPPPTYSSYPASNLEMSSGSQVQSRRNSHVSTPPPTSSCIVKNLSPPADHRPTTLPSSKPVSTQPPRRCFPCYGWIEDDEEHVDDFIQLTPMKLTTPLQSQKSSGGTSKCMKRKSRWDITPYDL